MFSHTGLPLRWAKELAAGAAWLLQTDRPVGKASYSPAALLRLVNSNLTREGFPRGTRLFLPNALVRTSLTLVLVFPTGYALLMSETPSRCNRCYEPLANGMLTEMTFAGHTSWLCNSCEVRQVPG